MFVWWRNANQKWKQKPSQTIKLKQKLTVGTAGAAETGLEGQAIAAAACLHAALGAEGPTAGQGA